MRLHEKYRPRTLGDIVGQDTADLTDFALAGNADTL